MPSTVVDKEPERLCLWCRHFDLETGDRGYSEYTPGSDFSMDCYKGHWSYKGIGSTREHYRACLLAATVCPDYEFKKELVQIVPLYKKK